LDHLSLLREQKVQAAMLQMETNGSLIAILDREDRIKAAVEFAVNNNAILITQYSIDQQYCNDVIRKKMQEQGKLSGSAVKVAVLMPVYLSRTQKQSLANYQIGDLVRFSVNNNIIAAGTNLATATALTKNINVVTDVGVDTGVKLPTAVAGYRLLIRNSGLNNVKLYPSAGASINDDVEGANVIVEAGAALEYFCAQSEASGTGGRWYTINATFA
jgi:hypothetical protein